MTDKKTGIADFFKIASISLAVAAAGSTQASSHREAPFISKYPQVDGTDFYMFTSYEPGRQDYVTLLANYIPIQAPYGGPNYFPLDENAIYEIHIDNDGDANEDITYTFDFDNSLPTAGVLPFAIGVGENQKSIPSVLKNVAAITPDAADGLALIETYEIVQTNGDRRTGSKTNISKSSGGTVFEKPFDYVGTKTFGGPGQYTAYANTFIHDIDIPNCASPGKVFVGQRHESFKIALGEVFDLVNLNPLTTGQDPARNSLIKNNVTTIALEVHKDCLTGDGNGVIGAWTTASLRQATILNPNPTAEKPELVGGAFTQVSRVGNFLVNELFIGYTDKDAFNSSEPIDDVDQFADYVTHPVFPAIVDLLFRDAVGATDNIAPSNIPRTDLVSGFLTGFAALNQLANTDRPAEMLRLNTNIEPTPRAEQNPLGLAAGDLAGFPNGRRPGDDTVDLALRIAMGVLCHPLPLGEDGAAINLGFCTPEDAPIGNAPLTDGVPISAVEFNNSFPYLLTPYPGSPNDAPIPSPTD